MNQTIDISLWGFIAGFLLLLIPVYFLYYFRTGLVKATLISASRMTIQLFLVGLYLEYLFKLNLWWVNVLWVLVMVMVASYTILKRTKLPLKQLFTSIAISLLFSITIIDTYFMGLVVRLNHLFEARYFIPVSGMLLGNMLTANVLALNSFFGSLEREKQYYYYMLGNGASRSEALAPFIREAITKSFNPTIASMAVMGLISLPGTMTGQILGGSNPNTAIKYQIMLMITIFASSLIAVLFSMWLCRKQAFDEYGLKKF
ncbi:ABC transporter permease [Paludibacter sp. 221]|uniref:ABC transporter permease n=1 Tax=Paludibacter sp. 221 TaxID=2302939 RepID=UPI0013D78067|nr:ABC transporter permease [Paludibacter sp. 221]NDV45855.1 ABC transporter permease [Paludibacter sp. 221]